MLDLGRNPLVTHRSRRRRDSAGIHGPRQLRALRANHLRRLVEDGRARAHPATAPMPYSSTIDIEAGVADARAAKRSCAGQYFHRKLDGGLRDLRMAAREDRRRAAPPMPLEPELRAELQKATRRGVPQMLITSASRAQELRGQNAQPHVRLQGERATH